MKLTCSVSHKPSNILSRIKLHKDNDLIKLPYDESNGMSFDDKFPENNRLSFEIPKAKLTDTGDYSLIIDDGRAKTSCNVNVLPNNDENSRKIKAPIIIEDLKNETIKAKINKMLTLKILVESEENIKVDWFFNDKQMDSNDESFDFGIYKKNEIHYEVTLRLLNPNQSNNGLYQCKISNSVGSTSTEVTNPKLFSARFMRAKYHHTIWQLKI